MAPLSHLEAPHHHRRRHQLHQPTHLGAHHDGGHCQERRLSSSNPPQQHHGINSLSLHRHHAQFPHRRPDDEQQRQLPRPPRPGICRRRHKRPRPLRQVLRDPCLLPPRLPLQRPVNPLLQPWQHPDQRPHKEDLPRTGLCGGVRRQGVEQGKLLLVDWAQSVLLLVPSVPVGVWTNTHGGLLLCFGIHAVLLGCVL